MKDKIQNLGDEVAIVIYDAPLPPKYFRLTKRFIKTLFVFVPLFLILVLFLFFSWGLGTRLKETPTPAIPEVMTVSESKVSQLENEVKMLQTSNKELSDKLAAGPGTGAASADDPYLGAIKKPYGMQNYLSQNRVTLDQFELIHDNAKVTLKFQIISANPETKVQGHVLVMMVSDTGAMFYPKDANLMLSQGIKYSTGEPFSVSRLRPTNAEFFTNLTSESVKFVIYIFTREGDLLLIRETESFKVKGKS